MTRPFALKTFFRSVAIDPKRIYFGVSFQTILAASASNHIEHSQIVWANPKEIEEILG